MAQPPPGEYAWAPEPGTDLVAYSWAEYDCYLEHGDISPAPLTDANLSIMYETELAAAECIRSYGLAVPDAPTFEVYAASRRGGGNPSGELWFARMTLDRSHPKYWEIKAACDPEMLQKVPFER